MQQTVEIQKGIVRRVLKMHALWSSERNAALLEFPLNDDILFEIVYQQVIQRAKSAAPLMVESVAMASGEETLVAQRYDAFLAWLAETKDEIILGIENVVDSLGGLPIASTVCESANDVATPHEICDEL